MLKEKEEEGCVHKLHFHTILSSDQSLDWPVFHIQHKRRVWKEGLKAILEKEKGDDCVHMIRWNTILSSEQSLVWMVFRIQHRSKL